MSSQSYVPSPNDAGAEAIKVAMSALGCSVEFVVLEEHRALVVAGVDGQTLKPRPPHPCEHDILAGLPVGIGPRGTAVAVELGIHERPGALFAAATLDTSGLAILLSLASMLAGNLGSPESTARKGFDYDLAVAAEEETKQRTLVQDTLANDHLVMFFQPIVDLENRPVGVEALARVRTEKGEIVAPSGFLDAIDGTDLMVGVDRQAFALSCRAATALARKIVDRRIYVACNFSAMTLSQPGLAEHVLFTIQSHGLAPDQLCIEVTETAVFQAGADELSTLRKKGVRIALDNFGTGYSELSGLRDLPLSGVKIDRRFTAALDKSGTERAIAATIVELARSLGLDVVAEGVENVRQWRAARSLGIERMQGWFYSPAVPFNELVNLIAATPDAEAQISAAS